MFPTLLQKYESSILRDITQWVEEVKGINLGQGVCQTPVPDVVLQGMQEAVALGLNRYAPPLGIIELRESIAQRLQKWNGIDLDVEQVAITHGSTGAWETVCDAFLKAGDEVILFRPFYPYHRKAIEARGARVKVVDLVEPYWEYDSSKLIDAFSSRTKLVVVCTPNNPTGKVFTQFELLEIGKLCQEHQALLVSDEVYEYMTYEENQHVSPASLPEISQSVLTMGSYSKTFSITGWRVGYLVARAEWMPALGTLLDRSYVCAPTPAQYAVLKGIQELPSSYYRDLALLYQHKRDLLSRILTRVGFECLPVQGAYYLLARVPYSLHQIGDGADIVHAMVKRCGVGAVPGSEFMDVKYASRRPVNWLRFCYSQSQENLLEVGRRLELLCR